jgi:hypothetical protein
MQMRDGSAEAVRRPLEIILVGQLLKVELFFIGFYDRISVCYGGFLKKGSICFLSPPSLRLKRIIIDTLYC